MGWQDRHYSREEDIAGPRMGGSGRWSIVTWLIIGNSVVFLLDLILGGAMRGSGAAPAQWFYFSVDRAIYQAEIWRWVTYQFVHVDIFHIFFNLLILWFFGPLMEGWWGSKRFLAFYLLCGMCGALIFVPMAMIGGIIPASPASALVGASGSVFGVLAGCAVLYPHRRVQLLIPPIPMSMRTLALALLGFNVILVLVGSAGGGGAAAHLGGALLGFLLVKYPTVLNWVDHVGIPREKVGSWEKRVRTEAEARQREQDEVDRILAKVKDHGLHSLTWKEKRTLQQATDRQRRAS